MLFVLHGKNKEKWLNVFADITTQVLHLLRHYCFMGLKEKSTTQFSAVSSCNKKKIGGYLNASHSILEIFRTQGSYSGHPIFKKKKEENIFSSHRISSTQKRTHTAKGAYLEAHDLSSLYNPARQLDPD